MGLGHGRMEVGESSRRGRQRRRRVERRESKSLRAGVRFPVGRIRRYLKNGRYAKQVRWPAAVFMAATLEYVVGEVLEASATAARALEKKTIIPRHIVLGVRGCKYDKDEENRGRDEKNQMLKLFGNVIIPNGGVVPHVHPLLRREKLPTSSSSAKLPTFKEGQH